MTALGELEHQLLYLHFATSTILSKLLATQFLAKCHLATLLSCFPNDLVVCCKLVCLSNFQLSNQADCTCGRAVIVGWRRLRRESFLIFLGISNALIYIITR
jgi:hypothetical protein